MKYLVTILLFLGAITHAETHEELVESAFDSMEHDIQANSADTEMTHNSEDKWQLLTVDDRGPTQEELDEFLADKGRDGESGGDDNDSMVSDGSLKLLEETDDSWLFRFSPDADDEEGAAFMKSVDGRLKVHKDGPYVALLSMKNDGPIKPGKGVRIKTFRTELEFAPDESGGPALPRRVSVEIEGRAFLRGPLVDDVAVHHGQDNFGLVNGVRVDLEDVLVQYDHIRFLADLD